MPEDDIALQTLSGASHDGSPVSESRAKPVNETVTLENETLPPSETPKDEAEENPRHLEGSMYQSCSGCCRLR